MNEPKLPHQTAVGNILVALKVWVAAAPGRGYAGMPADFRFDDRNVYAPDVWWVREKRKPSPGDRDLDGLPDIVVEVRSPSTWRHDVGAKRQRYGEAGIGELWLVDTVTETVTLVRRHARGGSAFDDETTLGRDDEITSALLPGFSLPVVDVFRI